jgi:hypothetical protein
MSLYPPAPYPKGLAGPIAVAFAARQEQANAIRETMPEQYAVLCSELRGFSQAARLVAEWLTVDPSALYYAGIEENQPPAADALEVTREHPYKLPEGTKIRYLTQDEAAERFGHDSPEFWYARARALAPLGSTVFFTWRDTTRSGRRYYDFYVVAWSRRTSSPASPDILYFTGYAAHVLGGKVREPGRGGLQTYDGEGAVAHLADRLYGSSTALRPSRI